MARNMVWSVVAAVLAAASPCLAQPTQTPAAAASAPAAQAVIVHYADLAQTIYGDAAAGARRLQTVIDAFLADPTQARLVAARDAWRAARIPYLQSEGFRFGNSAVDAIEPKVNAWPIDEGLIDYVGPAYGTQSDQNPLYAANVIARTSLHIGSDQVDATVIDEALLRRLQQAEGVETNVATGYHAVEFLLWGQDLHGTGPGAGERPASDYDLHACTHEHCDRRAAYLRIAARLLVDDVDEMARAWAPDGKARAELMAKGATGGLTEILTGIGSLGYGEMAGERMKLGLMLHDPEEEQDCFSDNTHNSHFYDETGIVDIWRGRYAATDGRVVQGPSLRDLAMAADPAVAARTDGALDEATGLITAIKQAADSGRMAYDQMLAPGNDAGAKLIGDAMDGLVAQTRAIEAVARVLNAPVRADRSDHAAKIR